MARVAGLFAGIGGFEVGFTEAGHNTILLCENDLQAAIGIKTPVSECSSPRRNF